MLLKLSMTLVFLSSLMAITLPKKFDRYFDDVNSSIDETREKLSKTAHKARSNEKRINNLCRKVDQFKDDINTSIDETREKLSKTERKLSRTVNSTKSNKKYIKNLCKKINKLEKAVSIILNELNSEQINETSKKNKELIWE